MRYSIVIVTVALRNYFIDQRRPICFISQVRQNCLSEILSVSLSQVYYDLIRLFAQSLFLRISESCGAS